MSIQFWRDKMNDIIKTKLEGFTLRFAEEKDIPLILHFIKSLAAYEKKAEKVQATTEDLKKNLFENRYAEVVFAEYNGEPVGYMLFFHNFSTFLGRPGIYVEDVFVNPELRGKGMGKIMFACLADIARKRNCGRMDWSVLKWNEPSIAFYKKIGSNPNNEWDAFRLEGDALERLANEF